jgi:hypothetical protein
MRGVWEIMRHDEEGESVVVIPSVSLHGIGELSGSLLQAYEERFLILLLLLRQPRVRMIYVTSMTAAWHRRVCPASMSSIISSPMCV